MYNYSVLDVFTYPTLCQVEKKEPFENLKATSLNNYNIKVQKLNTVSYYNDF